MLVTTRTDNPFLELLRKQRISWVTAQRVNIQKRPKHYDDRCLKAELRRIEHDWGNFCDDPITQHYGIASEFHDMMLKKKARLIFLELCERGVCEYDGDCLTESRY